MRAPSRLCFARGLVILVLLGAAACDGETGTAARIVLRDSAGVAIFWVSGDERAAATWTVEKAPELLIDDARSREPLDRVRAGRQFADSSFVIANEGSYKLLFYSRTGVLEHSVGQQGSGPNEFRTFDFLDVVGDSVWVYDRLNQRISVLDRAGRFARLIPLGSLSDKGLVFGVGILGDGSFLLQSHEAGTGQSGLQRVYRRHFVRHPDGSTSELGRFFRGESYWQAIEGDIVDAGRPFGREGLTAVSDSNWFYSGGDEYRVEQYDMAGRLRRVFSFPAQPRSVTQRDLEEYLKEINPSSLREHLLRRAPQPDRMPAYARLMIDRQGTVWAAPHEGPKPQSCWHVYQRRPPLFAKVCLPDRFTLLDIGSTSVFGVLRDENDLEQIARYRLVK